DPLAICGRSPLHAAVQTALAGSVLPDDLSLTIRIDGPPDAGLLTDYDQVAPARERHENRRIAKVEIGPELLRTARTFSGRLAAADENISGQQLLRPLERAGVHIERQDGIARAAFRARVLIAGGGVNRPALHVDGWRVPDGCTGRSPNLHARRHFSKRLG